MIAPGCRNAVACSRQLEACVDCDAGWLEHVRLEPYSHLQRVVVAACHLHAAWFVLAISLLSVLSLWLIWSRAEQPEHDRG